MGDLRVLRLTANARVRAGGADASSAAYAERPRELGIGDAAPRYYGLLPVSPETRLPAEGLGGVIRRAYPIIFDAYGVGDDLGLVGASIIAPTYVEVEEINDAALRFYPGCEEPFVSAGSATEESEMVVGVGRLNGLTAAAMPPCELRLKPDAPLILLRNIDPAEGLCTARGYPT